MTSGAEDAIRERLSGKYEFLEPLDERGSGAVFKVRDRADGSIRALKILTGEAPNAAARLARFRREAELAGEIRNRNIARVHAFQELGAGAACLEMELVDGSTLDQLEAASRRPGIGLAVEIARQALAALAALHRRRFAHCDVSPDNLILTAEEDGEPLVMLLDLGVAAELGEVPASGFPGKPEYAPPEQLEPPSRPVAAADDLYALAVVLYQLVTGRHPFPDRVGAVLPGGRRAPLDFARTDPAGRVPAELRQILLRALAEEPRQRFNSATELSDALAQLGARYPCTANDLKEVLASDAGADEDTVSLLLPSGGTSPPSAFGGTPSPPSAFGGTPSPPSAFGGTSPRPRTPEAHIKTVRMVLPRELIEAPPEPEPPPPPKPPPPKPPPPKPPPPKPPPPKPPPPKPLPPEPEPPPRPEPRAVPGPSAKRGWLWLLLGGATAALALFFLLRPGAGVSHTLRVDKEGAGSGVITSSPAGIDCGTDCSEKFAEGTAVRLVATADPGSLFAGWIQELIDDTVTLAGDRTVTAAFAPQPPDTPAVADEPQPPDTPAVADEPQPPDTPAVADEPQPPDTPAVAHEPQPPDAPTYTLTVVKAGAGTGRVTSTPEGIYCGDGCLELPAGSVVELSAVPDPGSVFAGWSPALSDGRTTVTADEIFIATFQPAPIETFVLTTVRAGSGSGRVTSSPPGIDCGNDCRQSFPADSVVRLRAAPDPGSVFAGWSPALSDGRTVLRTDQSFTATFQPAPVETFNLTVDRAGSGSGRVTSSPPGIDCGDDCRQSFPAETVVTLRAAPDPGSVFESWDPASSGDTVTLIGDREQTARFEPTPDEQAPTIELEVEDYRKKKEDAVLLFRIDDDRSVLQATAFVRLGKTTGKRSFPLPREAGEEDIYSLRVPADFHQGRDLYYWIEAEDAAGNTGWLGAPEIPRRVERGGFFERFENRFQRLVDKVRGKD